MKPKFRTVSASLISGAEATLMRRPGTMFSDIALERERGDALVFLLYFESLFLSVLFSLCFNNFPISCIDNHPI